MARPSQTELQVRFVVRNPVAGVAHSLQDKSGAPVGIMRSDGGEPICLDFSIRIAPGPKFYGDHVRSEGSVRRFVYVAVGQRAGDTTSCWDRRMKVDIHDIPPGVLDQAIRGGRLEATLSGTGADGSPSCATVPVEAWRVV